MSEEGVSSSSFAAFDTPQEPEADIAVITPYSPGTLAYPSLEPYSPVCTPSCIVHTMRFATICFLAELTAVLAADYIMAARNRKDVLYPVVNIQYEGDGRGKLYTTKRKAAIEQLDPIKEGLRCKNKEISMSLFNSKKGTDGKEGIFRGKDGVFEMYYDSRTGECWGARRK